MAAVLLSLLLHTASAQGAATSTTQALTLPSAADRAAHASLVPPGAPTRPEGAFDAAGIQEAAFTRADSLPAEYWEVPALAEALGSDPIRAFEFVRDHLAFDPYAGVLRGADGALAARAGNAWDRALLLQALLEANGHSTRLAFGDLSDETITTLLAAAAHGAPQPLNEPGATARPTIDVAALATRARRDYALLTGALADAGALDAVGTTGTGTTGSQVPDPHAAVKEHAWVQVAQPGGNWLDLDPSLASSTPGTTLTTATATADEVPAEALHQVTVRVLVESLNNGKLDEEVSLEQSLPAVTATHSEIWLYFEPEASSGGPGGIGGALKSRLGEVGWRPGLLVDRDRTKGTVFQLGTTGGALSRDFFGAKGPQLTRLSLEVATKAPGGAERTATRVLYDRVDPSDREAGSVTADSLAALPESDFPAALLSYHHVLVSTGSSNPREQAIASAFAVNFAATRLQQEDVTSSYPLQDLLFPLAVADQELVAASERVVIDGMAGPGSRAYVGGARVYLVSLTPYPEVEGGTASIIDLALDGVSFAGAASAAAEASQRLWYGVLQSALETQMTLMRSLAVDPAGARVDSVSLRMGEPLTVLQPTDSPTITAEAGELKAALADGHVAVSVGGPGATGAFWSIHALTGATSSVIEPGLRVGYTGGGGYVNLTSGNVRYILDETNLELIGYEKDGRLYLLQRVPPIKCSPGAGEYLALLTCVAIPTTTLSAKRLAWTVVSFAAWSVVLLELIYF